MAISMTGCSAISIPAYFRSPRHLPSATHSRASPDLRAPGIRNWDLSIFKDFKLRERLKLQFRSEAFNAFNTVRFGGPDTSAASNSFGVVSTQANSPRNPIRPETAVLTRCTNADSYLTNSAVQAVGLNTACALVTRVDEARQQLTFL